MKLTRKKLQYRLWKKKKKWRKECYVTCVKYGKYFRGISRIQMKLQPECERPKNRRCPPPKEEKKKEEKKKPPKKECITADEIFDESIIPTRQVQNLLSLRGVKEEKNRCKIKKFKFPKCGPIVKEPQNVDDTRCPKKKKPKFPDCPPDDEKGCATINIIDEYQMSRSNAGKDDKKKCPNVDMTIYKEVS